MITQNMNNKKKIKSVKSINPFKSVIQTIYDIVTKGHGEVPTTIYMKWKVEKAKEVSLL